MSERGDALRRLPGIDTVISALGPEVAHEVAADAARRAVDEARSSIVSGTNVTPEQVIERARALLQRRHRGELQRVINATGVMIHTNLGRVPLGARQLDAVIDVAGSYSNLEYDLEQGRRGNRYDHARAVLVTLTGAESALVVNNNAAAVLVVLSALCSGREVIVSRGELVEIGGEFRIPEVMGAAGARLVEVGTTNRTHIGDYERAISPDTAAIIKVHPSNYRVVGFTAQVDARDLARLAKARGVHFLHDLGSGLIEPRDELGRDEPAVIDAVEQGADVVTFSGDKLLGGPQAGIILGRAEVVARIQRHPLMRALRIDKMTLAAVQATLDAYLHGRADELPLWHMATQSIDELERRARAIAQTVGEVVAEVKIEAVATAAVTGGGSLPGHDIGSYAVSVIHPERDASEVARALRHRRPPVVGRVDEGRLLLDVRTVAPQDDPLVRDALIEALRALSERR